ncbi:MAG: hypothetical protein MK077_07955 [Phycisphaerales bacterium]|nr:hypothetical protein [Phycisphaerales bacterium]
MKTQNALGLGIATSLIFSGAAMADFYGLDYAIVANDAVEGESNWTVRIYAVMDDGERLDAVAGDTNNNKTLTTSTSFYQNSLGGPMSTNINSALFPLAPSLEFDSWVTIGSEDNIDNALNSIGIDWTNFENGGDLSTDNGTWYITPKDPQGLAVPFTNQNGDSFIGTLVAQVTVFGSDALVHMGAIFQGKDVNGLTWGPTFAEIDIEQPSIIDCNNNGVADDQDIANGTSSDCNGNGTPDECELDNGDCNENGVLDECEKFDDCNENGVPDECEEFGDCNDNGIPDECEDLQDWDGNGVADACEGLVAYNTTSDIGYDNLEDAINDSNDGDIVWVDAAYADSLSDVNFHGRAVNLEAKGNQESSFTAEVHLADGATFKTGNYTDMAGLRNGTSGTSTLTSDLYIHSDDVIVNRDTTLNLDAGNHIGIGPMQLRMNSELSLDAETCTLGGPTDCANGSTIYATMDVSQQGAMVGTFDLFGSMTNEGQLWATDDILITDLLTNDANITIYRGVLYVLGELVNNGSIFGEVDQGPGLRGGDGPAEGDGMRVAGNYTVGEDASIIMPHPYWNISVGGNLDIAITNSDNFIMNEATLTLNSVGDDAQLVEVLGADYGSIEEALDPSYGCTFPIGNVNVGSGAHVVLVDNRDNDCEGDLAEVMYAEMLIVEPGATLDTNGHIIYVADYDNQGTIIGEDDIIIIDPPVLGDLTGDGIVGIDDLLVVISLWGPCDGCDADFDNNGDVGIDDLLVVIANWS